MSGSLLPAGFEENSAVGTPTGPRSEDSSFHSAVHALWSDVQNLARGDCSLVLAHGPGAPLAVMAAVVARCGETCLVRVRDDPVRDTDSTYDFDTLRPADIHVVFNPERNALTEEGWKMFSRWSHRTLSEREVYLTHANDVWSFSCPRLQKCWPSELECPDDVPRLAGGMLMVSPDVTDPTPILEKLGWRTAPSMANPGVVVRKVDSPFLKMTTFMKCSRLRAPAIFMTPRASATLARHYAEAWEPDSHAHADDFAATAEAIAWRYGLPFQPVRLCTPYREEQDVSNVE